MSHNRTISRMLILKLTSVLFFGSIWPLAVPAQEIAEVGSLSAISDWDFLGGPDGSMAGIPIVLEDEGWVKLAKVDRVALIQNGVRLENIPIRAVSTSGVTRLSALRFILALHGLGFWVESKDTIVITNNEVADAYWRDEFVSPSERFFRSSSLHVRRQAAFLAAYFPLATVDRQALLITQLQDDDLDVRLNAAIALSRVKWDTEEPIKWLATGFSSKDAVFQQACGYALSQMGKKGMLALETAIAVGPLPASTNAAASIEFMGIRASSCQPAVIEAALRRLDMTSIGKPETDFLMTVSRSLVSVDDGKIDAHAARLLDESPRASRILALMIVACRGEQSPINDNRLVLMLADEDPAIRKWASYTSYMVGPKRMNSKSALEKAATDPDFETSRWAKMALVELHKSEESK